MSRRQRALALALAACLSPLAVQAASPGAQADAAASASPEPAGQVDVAFNEALNSVIPDNAVKGMRELKQRYRAVNDAMDLGVDVSLVNRTEALSLAPGAKPPLIRLHQGFAVGVRFIDATGAPWPISHQTNPAPAQFSVVRPEGLEPANLLTISALTPAASASLVITLRGEDTPITLILRNGPSVGNRVDGGVSFRVDRRGPNAEAVVVAPEVTRAPAQTLLDVLDGSAPAQARVLRTEPVLGDTQLWAQGDALYLRTPRALLWPAQQAEVRLDGLRAYRLGRVDALMVSATEGGEPITLTIRESGNE